MLFSVSYASNQCSTLLAQTLTHNVPNVIIPVLVFELTVNAAMEVGGSVCVVRIPSSNELKLRNQSVGR